MRSKMIFQILRASKIGQSKTGTASACNLNLKTINPYLYILVKNGLPRAYSEKPILYLITDRGLEALEHLRVVKELIPEQYEGSQLIGLGTPPKP